MVRETGTSQVAQWQRIRLPMQETQGQSLGQEDPLEEGVAASSTVLGRRIPQTEAPGGMSPRHLKELDERKLEELLRAQVRAEAASSRVMGRGDLCTDAPSCKWMASSRVSNPPRTATLPY